jgi:hypothetical protein
VPAPTSSRILTVAQRLDAPVALAPDQCRSLLDDLATIADPRQRRGRRHALGTVLAVAVAAVLAGASSLAAIGEWAADAPQPVLAALGVRRDPLRWVWRPPSEATVRRVLARVDPDALDLVIGRWLADQQPPVPRSAWRQAIAVDGKTLRGSGHHGHRQVHLLAVMDHTTNEIARFRPLLDGLDLPGRVITADALHTQREHAIGWSPTSTPTRRVRVASTRHDHDGLRCPARVTQSGNGLESPATGGWKMRAWTVTPATRSGTWPDGPGCRCARSGSTPTAGCCRRLTVALLGTAGTAWRRWRVWT